MNEHSVARKQYDEYQFNRDWIKSNARQLSRGEYDDWMGHLSTGMNEMSQWQTAKRIRRNHDTIYDKLCRLENSVEIMINESKAKLLEHSIEAMEAQEKQECTLRVRVNQPRKKSW